MAVMPEEMKIDVQLNKNLSMKILRWLWIVLMVCLFVMAFISVYILPETMARLMQITPFLTSLIMLVAAIAFGGSAIKRHDLLKNVNKNG